MPLIIEENKRPSFGQKFSNAVGAGLQGAGQLYQQQQQNQQQQLQKQAISKLLGEGSENLPLEFQKMAYESQLKQQQAANELQGKKDEKIKPFEGAFDILNRMKALRKKGNLGIGSTFSLLFYVGDI